MNRLLATGTAAAIGSAVAMFGLVQPAAAAECVSVGTGGSTWSRATATNCGGLTVQARIDRYYTSKVYVYTGGWSTNSYVSASNGTNAGNAWRWKAENGNVSAWKWM